MSEIGDDLEDVLQELGSLVSIFKYSDNSTTEEYIDPDIKNDPVYPWTSHFAMAATFGYSSIVAPGDLITFSETPATSHLLVSLLTQRFENAAISKEGVLYLCNRFVQIQRLSTTRDSDYDLEPTWPIVYSGEVCVYTGILKEREVQNTDYARFTFNKEDTVYISDYLDVRVGDRLWIKETIEEIDPSGECKEVLNVENKMFPGIKVCLLSEDNR